MASKQPKSPPLPTSLELLGARLQKIINSPAAQKARSAVICKSPDERQEDWESVLDAISETDGVEMMQLDDESVCLRWTVPEKD